MGKPFEITYSPSNWNAPAGGVATQWSSPYGGLNVQTPANQISPSQTPAMDNFMFRNAELRSRPNVRTYLPSPDGNFILGVGSFLSAALVWHTFAFTSLGLYQLSFGAAAIVARGGNPWQLVGGPALDPSTFVRWRVFQNILYYSNNNGHTSAWDGKALTPITDIAFLGAGVAGLPPTTTTLIGAQFIGELDNHLILASTSETVITAGVVGATSSFPQRIRWSNSGFNPFDANGVFGANLGTAGATFDAAVFVNSGFNDFLDVPDLITGLMFLGRVGYIFRQNGITEVSPTGQGTAPFDFNHLWASEQGIGNVYSTSIAQYGDMGIYVATDNVYKISQGSNTPIGGGSRDAIMTDLGATTQQPTAAIVPALTLGYPFFAYMLFIALPTGNTRVYVYSIEDNNWASWTIADTVIGIPYKCWIGDIAVVTTTQQVVTSGVSTGGTGGGGIPGGGGGQLCFSGNTLIMVNRFSVKPIAEVEIGDTVLTRNGWRPIIGRLVHDYEGPMHTMGNGELVTPEHHIWNGKWIPADEIFPLFQKRFCGKVYNLEVGVETECDDEHCYTLANGRIAHNVQKQRGNTKG